MAFGTNPSTFPWTATVVAAVLVVAAMVALVAPPRTPSPLQNEAVAPVQLVQPAVLSGTQPDRPAFGLRDPVPLYLPTPLNAAQAEALAEGDRREPVAAFRNYPARLVFPEASLRVEFPPVVRAPANAGEAIDIDRGRSAFRHLGRRQAELSPASPRLGYLEVVRAGDGGMAYAAEVPPQEGAPAGDWGPVSLVVAVNAAGLVGLPFVVQSSGSAQVDGWLPGYLAGAYRLGQRLSPGIYRIYMGP